MSGDQYDLLNPGQVRTTIASLPRRVREALRSDPSVDVESLATTAVPNGRSIVAVLGHLAAVADAGARSVHDIVIHDRPMVAAPAAPPPAGQDLSSALDTATAALERAAAELDRPGPSDWLRVGTTDRGEVSALDAARDTARRAVGLLKELERTVAVLAEL